MGGGVEEGVEKLFTTFTNKFVNHKFVLEGHAI